MRAVVEAVIRICETRWEGLSAEYAARRTLLALTRPSLTSSLQRSPGRSLRSTQETCVHLMPVRGILGTIWARTILSSCDLLILREFIYGAGRGGRTPMAARAGGF
jgi:hypothetical protein